MQQINEVKPKFTRDITSSKAKFTISESNETVNGFHTLAKVKGCFFVPNGVSRNNRYYSRALWEKQLARPEIQEKMKKRVMFGTIGHDLEIDDKALREGLVSHIVTNAFIDDADQGMGELYVLDTQAGKALNAILRAGCELNVSSRANGTFEGEKDGVPAVSEDAYDLAGWDFVLESGFLQAHPKLVESLNNLNFLKNNETIFTNKENANMETAKLNEDLVKATLNENKDLKNEVKKLNEEVEELKADVDTADKENKDLIGQADELKPKLEKLAKYEELGSPEEIKAEQDDAEKKEDELGKFKELGDTPEEVEEALRTAKNTVQTFESKFGKTSVVEAALKKSIEEGKKIAAHGGWKKIIEAIEIADDLTKKQADADADKEAGEVADELEMPKEEVTEMLKTMTVAQIKTAHKKISENFKKSSFVKKAPVTLSEGTPSETGSQVIDERYDRVNAAFR